MLVFYDDYLISQNNTTVTISKNKKFVKKPAEIEEEIN